MKPLTLTERLAVCSWSLHPTSPEDLDRSLQTIGIRRVQLALDPLRQSPELWGDTLGFCRQRGITIVSGMFGCVGEDYSTLDSIRATGGIAPDSTWAQNRENIQTTAGLAVKLGVKSLTFHAGFVPHDASDPNHAKMLERLREVANIAGGEGIGLCLETGQETAPVLVHLLEELGKPNVGVNFDPANMILYDKGNPIEAMRILGPWIRQVHIKDAVRTKTPGVWGQEVPVGSGEVDWRAFLNALDAMGFTGDMAIEREAGTQRVEDIRTARRVVEGILGS